MSEKMGKPRSKYLHLGYMNKKFEQKKKRVSIINIITLI